MLPLVLQIIAFILFILAAFGISAGKINLVALGLASVTLSMFIGQFIHA
jgi:hypothetical protein